MKIIKILIVLILFLIPIILFPINNYVELNDLVIIQGIGLDCNSNYGLYLQEVIPMKSDGSIRYHYRYYKAESNQLDKAFLKIKKNSQNKFYVKKAKYVVTNCKRSKKVRDYFHLEDITIYHEDKVLDKLKEIVS